MSGSYVRSADKWNGPNEAPRTDSELCRMLSDGRKYLINLDWQTLKPAEIFPREIYGGDEGDGNRWDFTTSNGRFCDSSLRSLDPETLRQAYMLSDAAKHAEDLLSIEGVESILGPRGGGKSSVGLGGHLEFFTLDSPEEDTLFEGSFRGDASEYTWSGSTVASSRESSVESDLLSISVSSDEDLLEPTNLDDKLSPVADRIARQLLDDFQRTTTPFPLNGCPLDGGLHDTPDGTPHNESSPRQQSANHTSTDSFQPRSSGKGLNGGRDGDEDSDDEGSQQRQPRKLPGRVGERRPGRVLACPFWKLDPSEHRRCLRVTMKDTSRVKQHLTRKHATDYYCERCMAVFPDSATHQTHIQAAQSCRPGSHNFTNITHQQQRQLSRKSKPGLSEMERWFGIWDIVFPGQPRPTSPYLDTNMSEDLSRFREFAEARAPAMIAAEIHGKDMNVFSWTEGQAASTLEQTISRGVTLLFDAWLADRASDPAPQKPFTSNHPSLSRSSGIQASVNPPLGLPSDEETPGTSTPFLNDSTAALDNNIQQRKGQTDNDDASFGAEAYFNWEQYINDHDESEEAIPARQGGTAGFDEPVVQDASNINIGGLSWEFGGLG
jgi:hypothetical protein